MKFGITPPYRSNVASDPSWMTDFVRNAESTGFESVSVVEHPVVPAGFAEDYPYSATGKWPLPVDCELPDPLELLAFLAARTERIVLSTGILIAPVHHPVVLAKRLATIDVLSGGRMRLGVGVGWMREEIEAVGIDFGTRGRRLDEIIEAMRALWTRDEATFHGEFFHFERAVSRPRPVQAGGVSIHIGGSSPAAARRAGRVGDGFQPIGIAPDLLTERLDLMRSTAEAAGRDPDAIELTLGGVLDGFDEGKLESLRAQGATRIQLSAVSADLNELAEQMWAVSPFIDNGTFGD
jgi:probable F420-dependent oxidoreductase